MGIKRAAMRRGDGGPLSPEQRLGRRRFLGLAGAAGVVGAAGSLGFLDRNSRADTEEVPLADAASPPDGARLGVRNVIWSVATERPLVAFTFDDGPDPALTPQILDILDRYAIKATFFVVGYNAERRPDLLAEAVARGHEIGNHTWRHVDLTKQASEDARRSIALGERAVVAATGQTPRYFRPPRGQITGTAMRYAAENGNDIVLWSVGRGVPGTGDARSVREHVLGEVQAGDIVLMHDGIGRETFRTNLDGPGPLRLRRDVEIEALPAIIEGTLERGLEPVTISGLVADAAR
jgi:peptidoglycan/xylan/chitin deacetylase (PgdA/CDA1 family)